MSWRTLPSGSILDLDTLPVGGKVRVSTWIDTSVEFEKLPDQLDSCATGFLTIVNAEGSTLERPRLFVRVGRLREYLASHFFQHGNTSEPLPRFLSDSLPFEVIGLEAYGRWSQIEVKTVEVWC